jgi:flagellar biosynthesis protein FliR
MTFTEAQITSLVASVLWPMVRIGALFAAVPVFSNKQLSIKVKALLSLLIAFMISPLLGPMPGVEVFTPEFIYVLFNQVAIGLVMGFSLQLVFGTLAIAGEMVGYSMKLGMAKMADPINGIQVPIVTTLYITLGMLVILALDIHLVMIQLLVESFTVFPVGMQGIDRDMLWGIIGWGTRMYEMGLLMALPIVGSILLLDIAQGVMQRAAQQLQIFAIGFPITLLAGMILIWVTLPAVMSNFIDTLNEVIQLIRDTLLARR